MHEELAASLLIDMQGSLSNFLKKSRNRYKMTYIRNNVESEN